jgi:hypothetical protein
MAKLRTLFVVALVTFLLGVAVTAVFLFKSKNVQQQNDATKIAQEERGPRLIIPRAEWEPFFFTSLEEHTKGVNLPSLRTILLPQDDLEIRFWYNALPDSLNGVILRRSSGQWSAAHLRGSYERKRFRVEQESFKEPKSGWEAAWEKLVNAGILTLPDSSEVNCHSGVLDGISYVVEINANKTYRTYRYGNPEFAQCNEAKQIVSIEEIIANEFRL